MDLPRYDLHCHSTASDGTLTPTELLQRAEQKGIKVLALTDHDTIQGAIELTRSSQYKVKLISGAELTCAWNGRVIHIVGLGFDLESADMSDYLQNIAQLRVERARKITLQLMQLGLPDLYDEAKNLSDGGSIGRPHFAKAMVKLGLVASEQQAFKKYLAVGKKGDVKMQWPDISDTVDVIKQAGGFSVIAHPTKYKMTFTKLRAVVADFVQCGGDGLEVSYPGVTPDQHYHLLRIADQYNLLTSAGSDFHSPAQGWAELGKYPPLKSVKNHILSHLL
ncbi:MAG: phosphatase [Neptuniibacter caesariensis]|uniref:Phosphatase n=1 Tax=Neptuniibacter caesariensis TaxID=207954 RepID=A0A2G6JNX9_NEPCE|nr:MAG: phosphatase [Neptuniibacter caesariensis]